MRRDRDKIELEMANKGLTGPHITKEMIDDEVVKEAFYQFPETTVTVACLTTRNGFTLVGQSACADPDNFDEEMGRRLAYEDAKDKLWALLGFRLRDFIHKESQKLEEVKQVASAGEPLIHVPPPGSVKL